MKQVFKLVLSTILIGLIISCKDEGNSVRPIINNYPTAIGTEWNYERLVIFKKYESDTSDLVIDIDTIVFTIKVWIDKDTILNDSMRVKTFKSRENNNNWTSNQYMFVDNDGLKTYAYSNAGVNVFMKSHSYINQLPNFIPQFKTIATNEIIVEKNPTLNIKLPLNNNSSWVYRYPTEHLKLQINKSVTGTENIYLFGERFSCYKISWNYLYDPLYEGIMITDWISNKGLVKRLSVYDKITFTDISGGPLNFGQMIETLILTQINTR